jgi:hypothetical protein
LGKPLAREPCGRRAEGKQARVREQARRSACVDTSNFVTLAYASAHRKEEQDFVRQAFGRRAEGKQARARAGQEERMRRHL